MSTSKESMETAANSLNLIINTVSANHDLNLYLPLLVRYDDMTEVKKIMLFIPSF